MMANHKFSAHQRPQKKAAFRFYEELNDFLPKKRKKVEFEFGFFGRPAVKMECNSKIAKVKKERILSRIAKKTARFYNDFYICPGCNRIYWQGSHYEKMLGQIAEIVPQQKQAPHAG